MSLYDHHDGTVTAGRTAGLPWHCDVGLRDLELDLTSACAQAQSDSDSGAQAQRLSDAASEVTVR